MRFGDGIACGCVPRGFARVGGKSYPDYPRACSTSGRKDLCSLPKALALSVGGANNPNVWLSAHAHVICHPPYLRACSTSGRMDLSSLPRALALSVGEANKPNVSLSAHAHSAGCPE